MRALTPVLVTVALVGAACSSDGPSASSTTTPDADTTTTDPVGSGRGTRVSAMTPFQDCRAFLDHVRAEARERVGAYGLDPAGGPIWTAADGAMDIEEAAALDAGDDSADAADVGVAAPQATTVASDGEYSTTNVQEVGVDEPDLVKTDGDRIVTVRENVLTVITVDGSSSEVRGRLQIPEGWGHELFIAGDRALLFTNDGGWYGPMPVEPAIVDDAEAGFADDTFVPSQDYQGPAALITEIDLSDLDVPTVSATMRIEGNYLSARAIDDTVRMAVSSGPQQLPWLYPSSPSGEDRAAEANRDLIDETTIEDWTPDYTVTVNGSSSSGSLLACDRVHHPAEFAGFDVISIVEFDLERGIADGFDTRDATGVLAGGQTVYSSLDRFYVATTRWVEPELLDGDVVAAEWNEDFTTELHAFSISTDEPTEYVASGAVDGSLLNQFSLDEHDGYLRVITTEGAPWGGGDDTETRLVILDEDGDRLVPVGEVGGLGRGEQLYSARLLDDIGFAVTFRQIDPFYVLDLSDPTNPRMAGELKIPGFSTYLHPVNDEFVLGVGQAATEEGRTTGLKLSLFDVSDPDAPQEVSVWSLPDASSVAEYDHRAFQMWGTTAIVPVEQWSTGFNGAIVFDVDGAITEVGRIEHTDQVGDPSSDCTPLGTEGLDEDTELFWMIDDQWTMVQHCQSDDVGGSGDGWCDQIPAEELIWWFPNEDLGQEYLAEAGIGPEDRIEICYPDDQWHAQIDRSLVIDDAIWTFSPRAAQANHLGDLTLSTHLPY